MTVENNPDSFRVRFCRAVGCPDSGYEAAALRKFLYPPWSRLVPVLLRLAPGLLATDLQILQQLGRIHSGVNFSAEVRDIPTEYRRQRDLGFLRRFFKLRLSRQRIFSASKGLWGQTPNEAGRPSA